MYSYIHNVFNYIVAVMYKCSRKYPHAGVIWRAFVAPTTEEMHNIQSSQKQQQGDVTGQGVCRVRQHQT